MSTPAAVWIALAGSLVAGGALSTDARAAVLVALAGLVLAAPAGRRLLVASVLVALAWGGVRAGMIDRAAEPVTPRTLTGERIRLLETLPARDATSTTSASARAVWNGRELVVSTSRFGGPPVPTLRRGWIIAVDGNILPLGRGPGDQRLQRQGVAGRVIVTSARDTGGRRGGVAGAIDRAASAASVAMLQAGGNRAGPLLAGMAIGNAAEVPETDRDALRAAGLWHLAAASGGNIALVVALVFILGWLTGVPDRWRLGLAAVAIAAYVPLAGAGPSIQRAGVMGLAALAALAAGREHRAIDALGLAAAATLAWDPRAYADVGWQLSFAATIGLLAAVGPGARRVQRLGLPRWVAIALATTAAATIATAPIMLLTFGSVSAIGLVTNVAATPLVAVTVWSGSLAALVAPWSVELARWVAEPGVAGAHATLVLAEWGAGRPYAEIGGRGLLIAALGAAIVALMRPSASVTAGIGVVVLLWLAVAGARGPSEPRLVALDIGQGNATLLQHGDEAVLVDAGPADGAVVQQLRRLGVRRLRALVLSHPAADHDGGAAAVLRAFPTQLVLDGGQPGGGPTHAAAMREASRSGARVVPVRAGQRLRVGDIAVRVRWPTPAAARAPGDPNLRSAVIEAQLGAVPMLLPGDAEGDVLRRLTQLRGAVLLVSHHGSADPDLPTVLRRLAPELAVISVGEDNPYGHPRPATLTALRRAGVPTLRTDQGGSVDVRVRGGALEVRRTQ